MTDIGSTLRDARIRTKIDIGQVEQATKIRAKYLRALENEEWGVLPGPSYVKSFLRTYAEYLGLDAQLLVEEYSARYEEPDELDVPAFAREQPLRSRVGRVGPPSRSTTIIALAVGLLVTLLILGLTGKNKSTDRTASSTGKSHVRRSHRAGVPTTQATRPAGTPAVSQNAAPAPGRVRVSVIAQRDVWVCLVDAKGAAKVKGITLAAGDRAGPFISSRFKVTLGNGGGDLSVNGNRRDTPESSTALGYAVSPDGVRALPEAARPSCG